MRTKITGKLVKVTVKDSKGNKTTAFVPEQSRRNDDGNYSDARRKFVDQLTGGKGKGRIKPQNDNN